ncbi:MAG: sensor histidine kinase [Spirochaetaceae bacterium]
MARILLLQDGEPRLEKLGELLEGREGVETVTLTDIRAAITSLEGSRFDLFITCLDTGPRWEALLRIASMRAAVICYSDQEDPELAARAIRLGAQLYLDTRRTPPEELLARAVGILAGEETAVTLESKDRVARLEAEARQFRLIFDHMLSGFGYHRILLDDTGRPVDFVFLEVNPAFEAITGLRREMILGRRISETQPGFMETDAEWIEIYGEVAITGKPIHFERYTENLGRWLEVSAYCPEPGHFVAVFDDITERKETEQELRRSLLEKTTLLREIHHRVKNNMQIVSSLLSLQLHREAASAQDAFRRSQERIQSMAMIHEFLYRSPDLARVELCEYFEELGGQLITSHARGIRFEVRGEAVYISGELAFSVGLVVSEALSNALVHGVEAEDGEITVSVTESLGRARVTVADRGPGFDPVLAASGDSLGYTLMREMISQIGGVLSVECNGGTRIILEFSVE